MNSINCLRRYSPPLRLCLGLALAAGVIATGGTPGPAAEPQSVAKWGRFERAFQSSSTHTNPTQLMLGAVFKSPSGKSLRAYCFWDGGSTWRVRFAPDEPGTWSWRTACSDATDTGLHNQGGEFVCVAPAGSTRFDQHGPIRVSPDLRYLMHEDGTPFFWLGDTAWNGALLSSTDDWNHYVRERARQRFTAVQFVATQWRAAPKGNRDGELAYSGSASISVNPVFFQKLDAKIEMLNQAGLLAVPVMLWAIAGGGNPQVNPGVSLPESQAAVLARYLVARWGASKVSWILAGDGDYRGSKVNRWAHIGRAVFDGVPHAPVTMHPGGMQWLWEEFVDEKWYDFVGYQSGHGDDDTTLRWLIEGPLTEDWTKLPHRPFINLEPPYENHLAYQSRKPHSPESVRRAIYWSLLNAPTAGVTYGGHGVWGWDDGKSEPTDHNGAGVPKPWREALAMPAAENMKVLHETLGSLDWWRLRPAPIVVVNQPGKEAPRRFIAAARTDQKDLLVIYVPEDRTVEVKLDAMPPSPQVTWINPRTGEKSPAVGVVTTSTCQFPTPAEGDWLLLLQTQKDKTAGGEK
jgi:hypothetical protein